MPKLKELSIQGFKSFADPLTLVFPTGITAVVGPNGSGKSNVADAIRWVLGEQRMTTLRGRVGEDMIFAGSKKRARSGMARVSLTFDNSDGWLPVDFAEVVVERRTYRDGKTDYILNGSRVRLMDIRDLLDRAGLGRDAYLTIGQGLVDQVLSLRASERLALFEQAAGIAPYRNRREDALKRLEETQHNLERVQDIIGEIEPQLRRLQRQVERAEQHELLTEELKKLLHTWYGYRWGQVLQKLESAHHRVRYRRERAAGQQEQLDAVTGRLGELRREMAGLRGRLAELHRTSSARHAEAERIQRELAVTRERRRQLQERREEGASRLVPLRSALEAEEQEAAGLRSAVAEAETELVAVRESLAALEGEYRQIEERRHALLRRQSSAEAQALEQRHQRADRQSRLEQLTERREQLVARQAQLAESLETATERRRKQQGAVEEARRALEEAEAGQTRLTSELEALREAQTAAQEAVDDLRRRLAEKRGDYQEQTARLEALERLHAEGAGLYAGVRAVLQAVERGELQGLPGTFAALIQLPEELDRALEAALGSRLQNVVARRWADARAAIEWLKRKRAGRATFLPLDNLRPSRPLDVPTMPGILGVAADLVGYDDPSLEPAVRLLLGRTVVAEDLESARALHKRMRGGFQIVTLEGEILRSGGSVTGGQDRRESAAGSLLARERERRELPEQVAALEAELADLREALERRRSEVQRVEAQLRQVETELRARERAQQQARRELDRAVSELERVVQETEWQRNLVEEAEQEQARLGEAAGRLQAELEEIRGRAEETRAELAQVAEALEALAEDELGERVSQRRTEVALLEQEHRNRQVHLESRERELRRLQQQIRDQEARLVSLAGDLEGLGEQVESLGARYEVARAAADGLSAQVPALEEELAVLEKEQATLEKRETEMRRSLREVEQRLSQAEVDARHREDQVQALRREIEEVLEIVVVDLPESLSVQQPLPLAEATVPFPIIPELPEGLEREIRDLRTQIRRLEPVNTAARGEYDEVAKRHTFLREQSHDLEVASAHLRQIIAELDEMMDTAFRTTFKAIASEFSRVFEMLFNGGTAKLALETNAEDEIVGVEITARPPGKRTSGLGMLSGGERSLTAVALLFAVMHISPTPFCVLDEVDAMLDEANVGRFRSMLRNMGKQIQFIVITHNRGTVEVADTIYGVSMGDDGVSQILSLSLEDLPASEEI
jgi:chromosome segregation protein